MTWLYGRHFYVETDAQTLVWLLNQTPNDLPNAMITRWLTYIRLFDFDVRYIPGVKNGAADALSRRACAAEDSDEEDDVDGFFDAKLYSTWVAQPEESPIARVWLLEGEYEGEDERIGEYLETLRRPAELSEQEFRTFQKKALLFWFEMDICTNEDGSADSRIGESSALNVSDWKFSPSFTTRPVIEGDR